MAEYFPELARNINLQTQEAEQIPNKIYPTKFRTRLLMLIKLLKTEDEENLESSQRKIKP